MIRETSSELQLRLPLSSPDFLPIARQKAPVCLDEIVAQLQAEENRIAVKGRVKGPRKAQLVLARARNNRNTLGSVRLTDKGWSFSFAAQLISGNPAGALSLGIVLLHRARGLRPPQEHLAVYQGLSLDLTPIARVIQSDPMLAARARHIIEGWIPELATSALPSVHWYHSSSRRILGRYRPADNSVGLHAVCRLPRVPEFVLNDVLHHELLHAALGSRAAGTRAVFHHAEFRLREAAFPAHHQAEEWIRRNLPSLLREYNRLRRLGHLPESAA